MYMNIIVQKYGGTSVKNKTALNRICKRTKYYLKDSNTKLIIVVSAQGKMTDNLISLSNNYSKIKDKKSLDLLLSTGETQTAALLCMMLNNLNIKATALTGWQAGILTDSNFGEAKILNIFTENIISKFNDYSVIIITGFQGADKLGNITTLGRGGSDLSATALAAALNASTCEIYSDIDGILSADSKICEDAKLLDLISTDEMIEAASSGAKVMHNRSVLVAKKFNVPIKVKNSRNNSTVEKCTNIITNDENNDLETNKVKLITKKDNLTEISIIGEMVMSNIEILKKVYEVSSILNVKIYLISFSEMAIHFIIDSVTSNEFINYLHKEIITEP